MSVTVDEAIELLCDPDAKWLEELGYTWRESGGFGHWTKFAELYEALDRQEQKRHE